MGFGDKLNFLVHFTYSTNILPIILVICQCIYMADNSFICNYISTSLIRALVVSLGLVQ